MLKWPMMSPTARNGTAPDCGHEEETAVIPGVTLLFLDDEKRIFMGVTENRECRRAGQMIDCVVAPFARGDAGTVGCQYLASSGLEK